MSSCMHTRMSMIVAVDPLIHVPSSVVQLKESCLFKQGLKEGAMKSEPRKWINFARYTNPPIGKGRIVECQDVDGDLYLSITLDGQQYEGILAHTIDPIHQEEE